jgi:hypothetical protein
MIGWQRSINQNNEYVAFLNTATFLITTNRFTVMKQKTRTKFSLPRYYIRSFVQMVQFAVPRPTNSFVDQRVLTPHPSAATYRLAQTHLLVSTTYILKQCCKVLKEFSWSITPSPSDLIVSLRISNGTS